MQRKSEKWERAEVGEISHPWRRVETSSTPTRAVTNLFVVIQVLWGLPQHKLCRSAARTYM